MQKNICPPFVLGTKVTSRVPGQLEMTVVVRGVFRLAPGEPPAPVEDFAHKVPSGDLYEEGDDERAGALAHASDFADFKLKTDLLLRGTCHPGPGGGDPRTPGPGGGDPRTPGPGGGDPRTPGPGGGDPRTPGPGGGDPRTPGAGRSAQVCTVRFAVGGWSKSLRVFGRRVWTERVGDPISEPAPFTSMPITYENAFGGPEYARNPAGRGYRTPELPTVEDPGAPLRSRRDTPEPAGFGPINPSWPQRSGKVGADYGKAWKKTRAPFYAADFDWSYWNAAPADQQLDGYLRGDEPLLFEYLHPRAIRFSASLPGVRPRVLCRRTDGLTTEVPMNLDTLIADLDGERLVLLWRGLAKVNDEQLDDVRTLFLGCEPLAAPRPAEHYLAELEALDADPVAYNRDKLLSAEAKKRIEEAKAMAAQAAAQAAAPPKEPEKPKEPVGRFEAVLAEHAKDLPPEQAGPLAELVGKLKSFFNENQGKVPDLETQARAQGEVPSTSAGLQAAVAKALASQKAHAASQGLPTDRYEAAEKQLAKAKEQLDARDAALEASGQKIPRDAAFAAKSVDVGAGAPGPGANLMERDLSGMDLRGADLSGALLQKAKLVGTKLAGANLRAADLGGVDLEGADLAGADLTNANLTGARAPGAVFDKATLASTIFVKTDLTGASLSGAVGSMVIFQEAVLTSAKLPGARLHKAFFGQAKLEGADFTGAELDVCCFLEVQAAKARFDEARLYKTSFLRSNMTGASFVEASGEGCSWQGSTLTGADFRFVDLPRSQLNKASLDGAKLHAANFKGSRFERASLAEADFSEANLMSASFNKAKLSATNFSGASLYDAKFLGAVASAKCNFSGANLKRAIWEQP